MASSNEMMHPDFNEWWVYEYGCSKGTMSLQTWLLGMFERFESFITISEVWNWFADFSKIWSKICWFYEGIPYGKCYGLR